MPNDSPGINGNVIPRKGHSAVGLTGELTLLRTAGFTQQQVTILGRVLGGILNQQAIQQRMIYEVIERRMNSEIAPFSTTKTTAPLPTTESRKYRVRFGGLLDEISAELNTTGSTDTEFDVLVNGLVVYSIVFPATETEHIYIPDPDEVVRVVRGDIVTTQVTTPGTGAIGLSVLAWISR